MAIHTTEVLTAILMLPLQQATAEASFGQAGDEVANRCDEAQFFAALAAELRAETARRQTAIADLRKHEDLWQLAALYHEGTPTSRVFRALADLAAQLAGEAEASEPTVRTAVKDFCGAANRIVGALVAAETVAKQTFALEETPAQPVQPNAITLNLAGKPGSQTGCNTLKLDGKTKGNKPLELHKITKLKITNPSRLKEQLTSLRLNLEGCNAAGDTCDSGTGTVFLTTAHAKSLVKLHASAGSLAFKVKASTLTAAGYDASSTTAIGQTDEDGTKCRDNVATEDDYIPPADKLAHYLCLALGHLRTKITDLNNIDGNALAGNSKFLTIANNLLQPSGKPTNLDENSNKEALEKIIKQTYTTDSSTFKNNFVETPGRIDLTYGVGSPQPKATLQNLAGTAAAVADRSYLQGTNYIKQLTISQKVDAEKRNKGCSKQLLKNDCKYSEGSCGLTIRKKQETTAKLKTMERK
ncbi:Variant Surface Glycoprotein [Trypanosoma brucei equiperdum]|uniref:Variant Surface Glycoprotein n=1 Tax=Trypanosoma brucei equiperdum TaxID=630700 RepID=A0A3L6LAA1_9TRYP|nr:Variant Surface Glycoprotein [Trypanosoma brucei equiperdum]